MKRTLQVTAAVVSAMLMVIASVAAQGTATPAASPAASPVVSHGPGLGQALVWLKSHQNADGSFPGFDGKPDAGTTIDAVMALISARAQGVDSPAEIQKAMTWLETSGAGATYSTSGSGQAAKLSIVLAANGGDGKSFAGTNLFDVMEKGKKADTGVYGNGVFDHALVIMAYAASGQDVPAEAIQALNTVQAQNGGFAFDASTDDAKADSNTTAMVVQALVAAEQKANPIVGKAMTYLKSVVSVNGASYAVGAPSDGNSTALVMQAYIATETPLDELNSAVMMFQNEDGSFFYMQEDKTANMFTTVQAIPAASGVALPLTNMPKNVAPVTSPVASPVTWTYDVAA